LRRIAAASYRSTIKPTDDTFGYNAGVSVPISETETMFLHSDSGIRDAPLVVLHELETTRCNADYIFQHQLTG
jgi:hypothetical protein